MTGKRAFPSGISPGRFEKKVRKISIIYWNRTARVQEESNGRAGPVWTLGPRQNILLWGRGSGGGGDCCAFWVCLFKGSGSPPGRALQPAVSGTRLFLKVHGILLCLPLELALCRKEQQQKKDQTFMDLKAEMWTLDMWGGCGDGGEAGGGGGEIFPQRKPHICMFGRWHPSPFPSKYWSWIMMGWSEPTSFYLCSYSDTRKQVKIKGKFSVPQ